MTDTTYTEYGYRKLDGAYVWPDYDGDLPLGSGNYAAASNAPYGEYSGTVIDVERIRGKLPAGAVLVTRTWSASDAETVTRPLPTTFASVIRATYSGDFESGEGVAVLADNDDEPWRIDLGGGRFVWVEPERLTLVETLFEAGK
jgi:hypothetical protein